MALKKPGGDKVEECFSELMWVKSESKIKREDEKLSFGTPGVRMELKDNFIIQTKIYKGGKYYCFGIYDLLYYPHYKIKKKRILGE